MLDEYSTSNLLVFVDPSYPDARDRLSNISRIATQSAYLFDANFDNFYHTPSSREMKALPLGMIERLRDLHWENYDEYLRIEGGSHSAFMSSRSESIDSLIRRKRGIRDEL